MKLSLRNRARIFQALKRAGHWYIVGVDNWACKAVDSIPNCVAITFDGFVQYKFELVNHDFLRLKKVVSTHYLDLTKGLKIDDGVTVNGLAALIASNPYVGRLGRVYSQKVSLKECEEILRLK